MDARPGCRSLSGSLAYEGRGEAAGCEDEEGNGAHDKTGCCVEEALADSLAEIERDSKASSIEAGKHLDRYKDERSLYPRLSR